MTPLIHTPTNNLANSLDFYTRLNFKVISKSTPTIVSDGKAFVQINDDRYARAGAKLYQTSWEEDVLKLKKVTSVIKVDQGYLLNDPSGMWIYLLELEPPVVMESSESSTSVLGNFAGMSLETVDVQQSLDIWQILGFKHSAGSAEQGWTSLSHASGMGVSIMKPNMCPHLFFNPSLTYFNGGKNPEIIEAIRKLDIPITEEITYFNKEGLVDNIIIRDPGGYGFFIFND